jgi:predicted signal transduction protein with EAL and GGDEF domain
VAEAGYADCDVSATVGYAFFPHHETTFDELVAAADSALMRAKDNGKCQVACADEPELMGATA